LPEKIARVMENYFKKANEMLAVPLANFHEMQDFMSTPGNKKRED
jgi:hypothetical protein